MARIDSLLNLVDRQGADELRLGTEREPQMFADGSQKRLSMPKTSAETLRELLGELLTPERERVLVEVGEVQFTHVAERLGAFRVALTQRRPTTAGGSNAPHPGSLDFDVVFHRGRSKAATPTPPPEARSRAAVAPAAAPGPSPAPPAQPRGEAAPLEAPGDLGQLLGRALALGASDVHLSDGEPPTIRIDGALRALAEPPVDLAALLGPELAAAADKRNAEGCSADLGVGVRGVGRFRLNVFSTSRGLAAAIRVLREAPAQLAQLGAPIPLEELVELPSGLVLVCGPTGCGKSSTLAALAQHALLRRSSLVITLEDPIEYELSSGPRSLVRQRQIGRDVRDFATGLRDALREDPDILLIGEMRDPETISLALTAAETGHLVLASLHSRSAPSTIERIVDTYPPGRQGQIRTQLADSLRAVVVQRLLPRANGAGRVLAMEVLRVTHAAASSIREGKTANVTSVMQSGKREGMLPLERCLADLVRSKVVSLEQARATANDPSVLGSYLTG